MLAEPTTLLPLLALLGLIVGSFLNVVIHRLPRMLERQWHEQQQESSANAGENPRYDLIAPRSHCPNCNTPLRWFELIPLLSWLLQRGRCRYCAERISLRYPLVELLTATAFVAASLNFDSPLQVVAAMLVSAFLIALAVIDFDTQYLPDPLTLLLLWLGLAASLWVTEPLGELRTTHFPVSPQQAILGALVGYLALWSVYWIFKLLTGREGMGHGDFKLLAALGAWLGPLALIPIMLVASISGSLVGLWLIFFKDRSRSEPIAFGPFIAAGGWLVLMFGSSTSLPAFLSVW